ncbi:hypothetical protein HPP92_028001 [Vanilla planifolia]|uniref:Uncharacterized protein n=1 Tax=Vanilla planifolia TaxID=51239 RepID=A0A835PD08_VANPL|nr:hypothetical protein HPP92_028001 [Vanilla planifolia]KAG0448212.1 hypothetical protein HPP92_027968 [Vanilla planifolia]
MPPVQTSPGGSPSRPEWALAAAGTTSSRENHGIRRQTEAESDWEASSHLPPSRTATAPASSRAQQANDVGRAAPEPAHPGSDAEVAAWQGERGGEDGRGFLLLVRAHRIATDDIREMLMSQCAASAAKCW